MKIKKMNVNRKKIFFICLFFVLSKSGFSQMTIHVTHEREKANVLVFKTNCFSEADLVIKKTWCKDDSNKPFHWYFVSSNLASEADWIVYYTDKMDEANHVVYFTENMKLIGSYAACGPVHDLYKLNSIYSKKQLRKWLKTVK